MIETDVLVVGAGPVGMTLALTLRKFGARALVVDRAPEVTHQPRAAVVWPRTLEALDLLHISQGWVDEGVPIEGFFMNIDDESVELSLVGLPEPFRFPLGIGQDRTEALLDGALRTSGADYRRGVELTDLAISASGVTAKIGGEVVRAAWVVGCEGSRSQVREAAGIPRPGIHNEGVQLLQAEVRIRGPFPQWPRRAYMQMRGLKGTFMAIPTHRDGHYRVLVGLPDDGATDAPTLEQVTEAARRCVPGLELYDPLWVNRFRTSHGVAERYRAGRALIVGDAAHTWVPAGGQGMNIGMQDAHNLGWKLAAVVNGADESLLDTYESERRPIAVANVNETERIFHASLAPRGVLDNAMRRLLPHLLGLRPVNERIAERFAEVDFHYPQSEIVGHGGGRRAPDGYLAEISSGETVRLFDLYRSGWTRLAFVLDPRHAEMARGTGARVVDATTEGVPGADFRDLSRAAARAFGLSDSRMVVVRPDGAVAFQGSLEQPFAPPGETNRRSSSLK